MKSVNKKNEPVKSVIQYQKHKGINSITLNGAVDLMDLNMDKHRNVEIELKRDDTKENLISTETPDFIEIERKDGKTFVNGKLGGIENLEIESLNDDLLIVDKNENAFYLLPISDKSKENLISAGNEIIEIERIAGEIDENGEVKIPSETKIFVKETEIFSESDSIELEKISENVFKIIYHGDSGKENKLRNLSPKLLRLDKTADETFITVLSDKDKENTLSNGNEKLLNIDKQNANETILTVIPDDSKENTLVNGNTSLLTIDRDSKIGKTIVSVLPDENKENLLISSNNNLLWLEKREGLTVLHPGHDSAKENTLHSSTPDLLSIDRNSSPGNTFLSVLHDDTKENTLYSGSTSLLDIDRNTRPDGTVLTILPDNAKENRISTNTPETVTITREPYTTKIDVTTSGKTREWDYYCKGDITDKDGINAIIQKYNNDYVDNKIWCKINLIGKMGLNTNSMGNIKIAGGNVILNFADCDCFAQYGPVFFIQAFPEVRNLIIENLNVNYDSSYGTTIINGAQNLLVRNCNLGNIRFSCGASPSTDEFQKFTMKECNCNNFSTSDSNYTYFVSSSISTVSKAKNIEFNFIDCCFTGHNVDFFKTDAQLTDHIINVDKCNFINTPYQPTGTFAIFRTNTSSYLNYSQINFLNSRIRNCSFLADFLIRGSLLNIQNNFLEVTYASPNHNGSSKLVFMNNFIISGGTLIGLNARIDSNYYIPENSNHYL